MANFRRLVLALLVVSLLGTGLASAQVPFGSVTCQVTSVVPLVRSEGLAELTGDIRAQCTNTLGAAIPADPYIVTNFSVALNTNITNAKDFGPFADEITDAVLVINENNYSNPSDTSDFELDAFDDEVPIPQYGRRPGSSETRLEWNGVSVPQPGGNRPGGGTFPVVTQLRWTNIRACVACLGVAGVDVFPNTQVIGTVSITSAVSISFTQNSVPVGAPIRGLLFSLREADGDSLGSPIVGLQCVGMNEDDGDVEDDGGIEGEFLVRLEEGFATAFKTIGVPTFQVVSQTRPFEAGYCTPDSGDAPPGGPLPGPAGICLDGGATQGTRFIIRFFNIPDGALVGVPSCVEGTGDLILDYVDANSSGEGDDEEYYHPDNPGNFCEPDIITLDISGGFAYAVYEVVDNDPNVNERADVKVVVGYDPDTANDEPAVGTMQVSADFAPLSTRTTSRDESDAPRPRFIETNAPVSAFSIIKCNTTLLFPFVTNQAGFDTGLAISNTSKDWLGTDPQNGACTIHYHGETTGGGAAPADQTSIVINAGEQLIFTLSGGNTDQGIAGAPDFQGYIIAVCEFQFGHGYAFITDGFGGIPNLAQGYLALIIETEDGERRGLGRDGSESLGH